MTDTPEKSAESAPKQPTAIYGKDGELLTGKARSLANLHAPFLPGNQIGLGNKGRPYKLPSKAMIKESLAKALSGGKLDQLMVAWVKHAMKGNAGYMMALLQRLDPVEERQKGDKIVFQGVRLEVGKDGQASVSVGTATANLPTSDEPEAYENAPQGSVSLEGLE
jgi:hypothetical protein